MPRVEHEERECIRSARHGAARTPRDDENEHGGAGVRRRSRTETPSHHQVKWSLK